MIRADRREAILIGAGAALLPLCPTDAEARAALRKPAAGRDIPFDLDWRFHRGEGSFEGVGSADDDWRLVDLPHDWSIEDLPGGANGPFAESAIGGTATGFTVGGEGWYRKHFRVDGYPSDARIEVLFEGAYEQAEAWLNGQRLGTSVHGYIPFAFDLTPHLDRSGDNVLAVRVRNVGRNSRWYGGSGIYRQVTLDVLPTGSRLARWGTQAWTRRIEGGRATIEVASRVIDASPEVELVTRLRDAGGRIVARASSPAGAEVKQALAIRGPRLWSPETPALYTLETELRRADQVIDSIEQPFGIRIVDFDARRGMTINGVGTKLYGGCIHHDNGLLGACAFPDADARRVRLLKARGFNAVRSSHNPSSRSFRQTCDRLGMLVIEEAFDTWSEKKLPDDFHTRIADHWQDVIAGMVLPARNSPSVIMWSIGNEVPLRSTDEGVEWQWKLANAIKRLDPTRPVTAGLNGTLGQEMIAGPATARPGHSGKVDNASTIFLDVPGYNYRLPEIEREHASHPDRVVYGSETFPNEAFAYAELMRRAPYLIGEFVWTAMDYIGEAGVANAVPLKPNVTYYFPNFPWVNAWCGDIDLIGDQKAQSRARDVAWGLSGLEMAVQRPVPAGLVEYISSWGWSDELPSWTWPGAEGKPLAVRLYTSGDTVEVRLNGTKLGQKTLTATDGMKAEFTVPYAPGTLEAVAWRDGKVVGRRSFATVGAPARLTLAAERRTGPDSRQALLYLPIEISDASGRFVPEAALPLTISISGPGELIGFGSGNPQAARSLRAATTETFHGRALAILRSTGGGGAVRATVTSPGLMPASITTRFT